MKPPTTRRPLSSYGVLLFHSDNGIRRWIGDALHSGHGTFRLVADTASMPEAMILARFHQPNLIVVGFSESSDMTDFLYALRAAAPDARIVGYLDEQQEAPGLMPAYDAFVTHKTKPQKLLDAFERAMR